MIRTEGFSFSYCQVGPGMWVQAVFALEDCASSEKLHSLSDHSQFSGSVFLRSIFMQKTEKLFEGPQVIFLLACTIVAQWTEAVAYLTAVGGNLPMCSSSPSCFSTEKIVIWFYFEVGGYIWCSGSTSSSAQSLKSHLANP